MLSCRLAGPSLCTSSLSVRWRPGRVLRESGPLVKLMAVGQDSVRRCTSQAGFWFGALWFAGWDFPKGHWRLGFPKALPIRNEFLQTGPYNAGKCVNSFDKSERHRSLKKSEVGYPLYLAGVGNECCRHPEVERRWRETRALVSDEPSLYLFTKAMTNYLVLLRSKIFS